MLQNHVLVKIIGHCARASRLLHEMKRTFVELSLSSSIPHILSLTRAVALAIFQFIPGFFQSHRVHWFELYANRFYFIIKVGFLWIICSLFSLSFYDLVSLTFSFHILIH